MFPAKSGRMALLVLVALAADSITFAQAPSAYFRLVREIKTGASPAGLAFSPAAKALLVLEARDLVQPPGKTVNIVMITLVEDSVGSVNVPAAIPDPINMAFDGPANRLLLFELPQGGTNKLTAIQARPDGLLNPTAITRFEAKQFGLQNSRGMTVDPVSGRLFILDNAARGIVRITRGRDHSFDGEAALREGRISQVDLKPTGIGNLHGLAFNPNDGHLYLLSQAKQTLYELTPTGQVVSTRDLSNSDDFKLIDPQGMVFAPSGDLSDDPALMSLYIADSGRKNGNPAFAGRIIELSFTEPVTVASTLQATLVQTTNTNQWAPSSPDPMGMAYIPTSNRFLISDSEVEEMPIFTGVNVFDATLQGGLVNTFSTTSFSNEPTDVAFNPSNQHLFFSDDDADEVFEINPGIDGQHFTADDIRTSFDTRSISNMDAEGIAYGNGNLYLADGLNSEVWEIRPGVNGRFDGRPPAGDDQASHFDTSVHGIADPEAVEFNSSTGTLYITGHGAKQVIETTTSGSLLNVIDITFLNAKNPSGLAYAPGSVNPPAMNLYIVARGVDNDSDPNENDGKMYEIFIGGSPPIPSISIYDMTVTEGNSGTVNAVFTMALSAPGSQTVTVDYATADGAATAGSDYVAGSETVSFPVGTTTRTIPVVVNGDVLVEPNETFFVNLSNSTNATIADNQGQGTITDDDLPPTLTVNNVTVPEGSSGAVNAVFTVTLSAAASQIVTVAYATADGTATAGSDYVAGSGTVSFPVGTTTRTIPVVVNGDVLIEPNETFFVNLSNPTNASIADNQGQGTIINHDPQTTITLNPTDDAHVESKVPTKNFGASSNLHIKQSSSSIKNAYLKFVVNGVAGPVQSAKLRLKVTAASNSGGSVFLVSNNYLGTSTPWMESGLNYNNAPSLGGNPLSAVGSVTVGQVVEFDVTAAVTGNNTYSFGMKNASSTTVYYSSKEGSTKPELVIQFGSGAAPKTTPMTSRNDETTSSRPERLELRPNYPNPFNAQTVIDYALLEASRVRLVIYDILGQRVRKLVDEIQAAGYKRAVWDGKNEYGHEVGSGVYLYQLEVDRQKLLGKLILQR